MSRRALWLVPLLSVPLGCLATIPPPPLEKVAVHAALPELPPLQPCVLLEFSREQPLSDVVSGGESRPWNLAAGTIWIPHAKGPVLIDAGVGRQTQKDLADAPSWFRQAMGDWSSARPVVDVLSEKLGVAPDASLIVLSTHVHWDHVGGLRDLPNAKPLLWDRELAFWKQQRGALDHGVMPNQLAPLEGRLVPFKMDGPAYEGFPASHDVLGDGSVIAVPLPGHTPGSTAFFVNSGDGRRWLFTGDTTWSLEGIERPAHKPYLASSVTDSDDRGVAESIAMLNAFAKARPEIVLVPAHDLRALQRLPACGAQGPR